MQRVIYSKSGQVLLYVLDRDMHAANIPIIGICWFEISPFVQVDYDDTATPSQMAQGEAIVAAHVPTDTWIAISQGAEAAVEAIPSWAHYREDEAQAWWETNIHTPLVNGRANLPATIPFSAAGMTVIRNAIIAIIDVLDKIAAMQWAMARLLIALRNKEWPKLQNPPAGLR